IQTSYFWQNMDNYDGVRERFSENSGPRNQSVNVLDIVQTFLLFFTEDFVNNIVQETNTYAQQFICGRVFPFRSPARQWVPVTLNEMYVVLALFLLMGIVNKPTLNSYFSTKRLLYTPAFPDVISRDRFQLICKFLHFNDNTKKDNYLGPTRLFKIFPVIQHLNEKFQTLFYPGQNICIDESLTLWKGRLAFKMYLPLKASKFGIKTYELCDSKSGYLWSFIVYTGSETQLNSSLIRENTNKTTSVVLHLVEPLLHRGHTLWMDNYYNSPQLAKLLKNHGTDCVGTLRLNRKGVPTTVKNTKLRKGEIIAQHAGPITVLKWQDKKPVSVISTFHNADTQTDIKRNKEIKKPKIIIDYNEMMGGVDLKDQLLQYYNVERKRLHKWYMKLFRCLLNVTVVNGMIIYNKNQERLTDHLAFRVNLVEGLLLKFTDQEQAARRVQGRRHSSDNTIPRLRERHFISKIPPSGKKARPQRRCVACTKNKRRKETVYWCSDCDVGPCIDQCFQDYHTKLNF
ncbi:hypothetical protein B7P43_G07092, partial [Cryptotermes secundus]